MHIFLECLRGDIKEGAEDSQRTATGSAVSLLDAPDGRNLYPCFFSKPLLCPSEGLADGAQVGQFNTFFVSHALILL
jgi:hypothetical protein